MTFHCHFVSLAFKGLPLPLPTELLPWTSRVSGRGPALSMIRFRSMAVTHCVPAADGVSSWRQIDIERGVLGEVESRGVLLRFVRTGLVGRSMVTRILITIALMLISLPVVGTFWGLGFGYKAERFVYPTVLIVWGVIIYQVWFAH